MAVFAQGLRVGRNSAALLLSNDGIKRELTPKVALAAVVPTFRKKRERWGTLVVIVSAIQKSMPTGDPMKFCAALLLLLASCAFAQEASVPKIEFNSVPDFLKLPADM